MHAATPTAAGYAGREVTHPPEWHGLVVWDTWFNAFTTGLFLVAALGELARPDVFAPLAAWAFPIALAALLIDLSLLVLDLGDPLRFHHMLRVFKPSSPMSLGTWCLTAYSLPLTLIVALQAAAGLGLMSADSLGPVRVGLLVLGLPFAFGSAAYKGVLFSTTAQPGWRDARWLGAFHLTGAVAFGTAALLLLAAFTGHDRATAALRPALGAAAVLNLVALALLLRELGPALAKARTPRAVAPLLLAGAILPLGLLPLGEYPSLAAAGLLLAIGFAVRSVVVHLPHHFRS